MTVRPAKTQISLGIRLVWSESSLSAWTRLESLATHWTHSEDSGRTDHFSRGGSNPVINIQIAYSVECYTFFLLFESLCWVSLVLIWACFFCIFVGTALKFSRHIPVKKGLRCNPGHIGYKCCRSPDENSTRNTIFISQKLSNLCICKSKPLFLTCISMHLLKYVP